MGLKLLVEPTDTLEKLYWASRGGGGCARNKTQEKLTARDTRSTSAIHKLHNGEQMREYVEILPLVEGRHLSNGMKETPFYPRHLKHQ